MINRLTDFTDLKGYSLPFLVFQPHDIKFKELSVRVKDSKWPTLWFILKLKGYTFRVKEFFMDWFFLGFPKSLMKDFSSSYSPLVTREVRGFHLFIGRNYHGKVACSVYVYGTQVEIESDGEVDASLFEAIVQDLLTDPPSPVTLSKFQFPDRSHFAKGYSSDWYEDARISRLQWRRTPAIGLKVNDHKMLSSGLGFLQVNGYTHEIIVLQENYYRNGIWIEVADEGIGIKDAIYNVRLGKDFYDTQIDFPEHEGLMVFRKEQGPGVLRLRREGKVYTMGFSPGFKIEDVEEVVHGFDTLLAYLETIRNQLRELRAYP